MRIPKKISESLTDTIKNTSRDISKTITEFSIANNKAIENLNEDVKEILNDWGILTIYLMSLFI